MPTVSPWIDLSVAGLVVADLTVSFVDLELTPLTTGFYTAVDGVAVEYADATTLAILGAGPTAPAPATTFRLTGIPTELTARELEVWETATPANSAGFTLDGTPPTLDCVKDNTDLLVALLEVAGGTTPVTFTFADQVASPVVGVEVSVWDTSLSVPVVPKVVTNTAGAVTVGLPPGMYKAFYFKPYTSFLSAMPVEFTVTGSPLVITEAVDTRFPALPTLPRITFHGWVRDVGLNPVEGAEVRMRILKTPQIVQGGVALSRFELVAVTDANGKFELFPVGGALVKVTSEAAGYDRKGRLPLEGQINWDQFAKESIPT